MKITILKKILAIMLVLTIIPLAILGYVAINDAKELGFGAADSSAEALKINAEKDMLGVAENGARCVNEFFSEMERSVEGSAKHIHKIYTTPKLNDIEYQGNSFAFWATNLWIDHTNKEKLQNILDGIIIDSKYNDLVKQLDKEQKSKLDEYLDVLLNQEFPNVEENSEQPRFMPRFVSEKSIWGSIHSVIGTKLHVKNDQTRYLLNDFLFGLLDQEAQSILRKGMHKFEVSKFIIDSHPGIPNARLGFWGNTKGKESIEFTYSRPGEPVFHTASNGLGNSYYCKSPWALRDVGKVKPVWSTAVCTRPDVIKVIHPIYEVFDNPNSELVGFIEFPIDWATLSEQVVDVSYSKTGYMLMIDDTGKIISHPDPKQRGKQLVDINHQDVIIQDMIDGKSGTEQFPCPMIDGDVYFTYAPIEGPGWSVALVVPVSEIVEPAEAIRDEIKLNTEGIGTQNKVLFITLITMIIVIIMSIIFAKKITNPIKQLKQAADKVTSGEDATLPRLKGNDEIAELTGSMAMLIEAFKFAKKRGSKK
jgi:HAMP domain-containing protein